MQNVTKQYPGDDFKIQKKEVKLVVSPALEAEIRINFEPVLGGGWVAANVSGHWEVCYNSMHNIIIMMMT